MLNIAAVLTLWAFTVSALPLDERQTSSPSVTIRNGTVVGSSSGGVDSFKGIPFAQPPVGDLRLRAPKPLATGFGTLQATAQPKACPQFTFQVDYSGNPADLDTTVLGLLSDTPYGQTITNAGEDCLTLNVQRPSTATSSSKLPVVFWIYGGGFEFGSTQSYDGTSLVQRSVSMGKPVIYVAVNYRVSGFGFLAGDKLAGEGNTNLGLRDQRLGLQWVADNIAAFGGDPTKVTIWGESAGSISVFDQSIINGGDNTYKGQPLFRGAIMDSGSITPADPVTAPQAQAIYNTVVKNAGCSGSSDTLACLRSKDYTTFLNAVNSVPAIVGYRSVDLSYLPRPDPGNNFFAQSPDIAVQQGKYVKVPSIIGDQEDEGTLFALSQSNITNNAQLVDYLSTYFPSNTNAHSDVSQLVSYYPDDLGQAGSPFNTGVANNIYPEYKRLAAILGDITFTLTRRVYLSIFASQQPTWSYLSSYFYGTPVLGTFHATDIIYGYGELGPAAVPTVSIQSYYIAFINNLDPNSLGTTSPLIKWPQYKNPGDNLLHFNQLNNDLLADNFRNDAYNYLRTSTSKFRV